MNNNVIIKKVSLRNFRSHESYQLDCNKETTLILGENGCGKTSVLEAIYIALYGKSFRATDRDILKREMDFYRIELDYINGGKTVVTYDGDSGKKMFLIQDKKSARLPKKHRYPVILFLPEDLHLIATSPTKRRDYCDRVISQLNEKYSNALSRYNKALKQRNELLKQENITQDMLFSWDIMLAKYGVEIRKCRADLVDNINQEITKTYHSIAKNNDKINLKYQSNTGSVEESEYLRLLAMDADRDIYTGHTNFGIHKDDYEFIFNGNSANGSASRGEVRSIILALKFIEARNIYRVLGKKPVVLLDDVFSELDKTRQKSLVDNFKDHQVILTSVEGVD